MVKVQVKAGSTKAHNNGALVNYVVKPQPGATRYVAKFLYRPLSFLVNLAIIPDPNPEAENEAEAEAEAGPSSSPNKRKRDAVAAPEAGPSSAGGETAAERKKRLRAELIAIKQELGDDLDDEPLQPVFGGDGEEADVKPAPVLDPARLTNQKIYFDMSALNSDSDA